MVAALELSLSFALRSVLLSLPLAILLAWILTRRRFIGRTLLDAVVHLPLVLPPVAVGYCLLVLFGTRGIIGAWLHHAFGVELIFTRNGAALATAVMSFPLMVRAIRISLEGVDRGFEDAARTLGAGPLDRFLSISLPLMLPGILAGVYHRIFRRPRRIRRRHHLRIQYSRRNPHPPARLVLGAASAGRRACGGAPRDPVDLPWPRRTSAVRMVRAPGAPDARPMTLHVSASKQRGAFTLDILLEIDAPGVVALFGPSGCGKSTAIDIIAGLLPADRGRIVLDGKCCSTPALRSSMSRPNGAASATFSKMRVCFRISMSRPI